MHPVMKGDISAFHQKVFVHNLRTVVKPSTY